MTVSNMQVASLGAPSNSSASTGTDAARRARPALPMWILPIALAGSLAIAVPVGVNDDFHLALLGGGAMAAGALALLGAKRIEWFLLCVLVLRPIADIFHPRVASGETERATGPGALALSAMLLAFGMAWLASNWANGRAPVRSYRGVMLTGMVAATAISAIAAPQPSESLQDVARLASAVMLFLLVERMIESHQQLKRFVAVLFLSAIVPMVVGFFQILDGKERITGTTVQFNGFGFYLALVVVMGVAICRDVKGRAQIALALVTACAFVELVFTYSRGAWIAAFLGVSVVGLLRSRKILVGLALVLVCAAVFVPSTIDRVQAVNDPRDLTGRTGGNSVLWRLDYWRESLSLSEGHELFGIGFGMTRHETGGPAPHNDFIRMFVETGLLGLSFYLATVVTFVLLARRLAKTTLDGFSGGLIAGFAGCTTGFVSFSISGNLISAPGTLWYYFYLAGMAGALSYLLSGDREARSASREVSRAVRR